MKFAGTPTFGLNTQSNAMIIGAKTKAILLAWQALAYECCKTMFVN